MASSSGRQFVQRSTSSARSFMTRTRRTPSIPSVPSGLGGPAPASRLSRRQRPFFSSRLPVELGCAASLMPLHSATASALLKSMLSSKIGQWGVLSEGFATPL